VPFFIAAWFGVNQETDAFFYAYGLILFLSGIFAPVVESVIVPYIAEGRERGEDVGKFVGNILGVSGTGLFVLTVLVIWVVKPILSIIARFDEQMLRLIYQILVETSPLIILLVWTSIFAGTLNAYKRFSFPAVSPVFRTIIILIVIFAFKDIYGVHSIAFGYIVGEFVRLAIFFAVIKKLNIFKFRLSFQVSRKLMEFFKTSFYQAIGMAAVGLNPFIDKTMATWLDKGSVSVLHYADRLYMIPVTFMASGLMVTLLSHWSQRCAEEGTQKLKKDVTKAIKVVVFIALPMVLVLIFFHQPIVSLAFGRTAFDQALLSEVGWVWTCYLFGFVLYMVGQIFVRANLTVKNTKSLMVCAVLLIPLNILLNYVLMRLFNVAGIALATSLSRILPLLYLSNAFYKKIRKDEMSYGLS
jgi:putative peptidoglycan lipid II flippase